MKKRFFIALSTIIVILVGIGIWYGIQVSASRKYLEQIKDKSFEELLQEALEGKKDAVVTVGIVKNGETSYSVYGADGRELEPEEYLYEIGSITKTMTGTLIARAVQEGRLSLEDPIDTYLELPKKDTYPTIASLLTHTSGLDDYYFEWGMLSYLIHPEKNPFQGITDEMIWEEYKRVKLKEDVEYKYSYSNYGFVLLGLVIENVYDRDYETLLHEYLHKELNMQETHIAKGDASFEGSWEWNEDDAYIPVGAVYSNISDMLLYASAQLGDDSLTTMCHQSVKQINASDKWDRMAGFGMDEMGMGWMIDTQNGFIWHNGGTGLHTSYLGFCPEKGTAVVILSNLDMNEDIPTTTLGFKKLMEISGQ